MPYFQDVAQRFGVGPNELVGIGTLRVPEAAQESQVDQAAEANPQPVKPIEQQQDESWGVNSRVEPAVEQAPAPVAPQKQEAGSTLDKLTAKAQAALKQLQEMDYESETKKAVEGAKNQPGFGSMLSGVGAHLQGKGVAYATEQRMAEGQRTEQALKGVEAKRRGLQDTIQAAATGVALETAGIDLQAKKLDWTNKQAINDPLSDQTKAAKAIAAAQLALMKQSGKLSQEQVDMYAQMISGPQATAASILQYLPQLDKMFDNAVKLAGQQATEAHYRATEETAREGRDIQRGQLAVSQASQRNTERHQREMERLKDEENKRKGADLGPGQKKLLEEQGKTIAENYNKVGTAARAVTGLDDLGEYVKKNRVSIDPGSLTNILVQSGKDGSFSNSVASKYLRTQQEREAAQRITNIALDSLKARFPTQVSDADRATHMASFANLATDPKTFGAAMRTKREELSREMIDNTVGYQHFRTTGSMDDAPVVQQSGTDKATGNRVYKYSNGKIYTVTKTGKVQEVQE